MFKTGLYTLFQNVPNEIPSLCTLYYQLIDYFEIIANDASVSNNGYTLTKKKGGWNNASWCSFIINSTDACIYKWCIKYSSHNFFIGIASDNIKTDIAFDEINGNKFYCICPIYKTKKCHEMNYFEVIGADKCTINDKMEMWLELNMKNKTFSIYDDKSQIILFENVVSGEHIKYRLAITAYGTDAEITINEFVCLY